MRTNCPACGASILHGDVYSHNGDRVCRCCLIKRLKAIGTAKAKRIIKHLEKTGAQL